MQGVVCIPLYRESAMIDSCYALVSTQLIPRSHEFVTVEVNHVVGHFSYPNFGFPCELGCKLFVGGEVEEGGYL